MTPRTEQILKNAAAYFDLHIEYVNDLSDKVAGLLKSEPDLGYIVINVNKPRCDQVFTIAHEIGHYVIHVDRPPVDMVPWYLKIQWRSAWLCKRCRVLGRCVQRKFGREWQADFWAFVFLFHIGAVDDLIAIQEMYPQKRGLFWLSYVVSRNTHIFG